jgi:hypothetical protein
MEAFRQERLKYLGHPARRLPSGNFAMISPRRSFSQEGAEI